MKWWELFIIILRNIRNDFQINILSRFPLLLILNPDAFEPPFTNGFDEFFNVTTTTTSIIHNQYSNIVIMNYMIVGFSILLAWLDIIYSILRLAISTIIVGMFMGSMLFFSIWFYVTVSRRWKVMILVIQNNEFFGIW